MSSSICSPLNQLPLKMHDVGVCRSAILLLSLALFCHEGLGDHRAAPRVHLSFKDLMDTRTARPFSFTFNTSDYRILLMDQDQDRMYLGAREFLIALDLQNINKEPLIIHWPASPSRQNECRLAGKGRNGECYNYIRLIQPLNRTHLYTCGTGAYHPICALVNRGWRSEEYLFRMVPGTQESGKGKCPYDPRQDSTAALVNGNLYSGVQVDFMGTDAAVFRTMGSRPAIRTEQHDSRWLNEPVFLHAHMIPDSSDRNDDKLYFLFREKALEGANGPAVLSRIGRVCLNDNGGLRSLVNKWTTFLKARLVCSVIGQDGVETFFDELRDVFIQPTQDEKNPLIYAVFSTLGSVFKASAVCVYSMADVRTVFNGPFAHKEGHNYQWVSYLGKIPYPRPGACPGGTFTPGIHSTKEFSDELVNFIRTHPLMYNAVYPVQRRPLVVRTGVDYKFTSIAVDLVDAVDGRYEVLFLGTDHGTVQKIIVLPKDHSEMEELTLEEVEVFRVPAPVKSLRISSKRQQLYVSSATGVTQITLHRCPVYGQACADCCLARDPYCAWDGESCSRYTLASKRRSRRQDIKHGDPLRQCRGYNAKVEKHLQETVQYGVEGTSVFLECQPRSPQAAVKWLIQREGSSHRKVIGREKVLVKTGHGMLLRTVLKNDTGLYHCVATENRFKHTVARIRLRVLDRELVDSVSIDPISLTADETNRQMLAQGTQSSSQDVLQTFEQPEIQVINQYCKSYWHQLSRVHRPKRTNEYSLALLTSSDRT
ncbi:semaphorin-3F-like isoform X1 [Rhinatrema bivittatum]|uniref:semaphorin-3F-like isoform X1 n=1 Tax=Rhinatrema bivittatum TaxID=194408 RepID=UPI0011264E27|nr:semaphorin-3F-like isoform X1 [Rhinatrema bivittatum]